MLVEISPINLIWARGIFTVVFSTLLLLAFGYTPEDLIAVYQSDGLLYLAATTTGSLGLLFMIRGLNESSLSQLSLFLILISIFSLFGVSLTTEINEIYLLGVGIVFIAYLIHSSESIKSFTIQKGSVWFILMVIAFTVTGFINWHLLKTHDAIISVWSQEVFLFLILSIVSFFDQKNYTKALTLHWKALTFFATLIIGATYFGAIGLQVTDPLLLSVISLISPIITAFLGKLILKEKWPIKFYLSFGLIIVGIVLLLMK